MTIQINLKLLARVRFATAQGNIYTNKTQRSFLAALFLEYYERKLTAIAHLGTPANSGH